MGDTIQFNMFVFIFLLIFLVCLALCFYYIGWSILAGFASILIMAPFIYWISKLISNANKEVLQFKDERAKVC